MEPKLIDPILVDQYLLIYSGNSLSQEAKRIKKKFRKNWRGTELTTVGTENFIENGHLLLGEHIRQLKRLGKFNKCQSIGVIVDCNKTIDNITLVPPPPLEWDILCLQSDIHKYNFEDANNSIYWCKSHVNSTYNFVINAASVKAVEACIGESKNWNEFTDKLNTQIKLFSMARHLGMSENISQPQTLLDVKLNNVTANFETVVAEFDKMYNSNTLNEEQRWNVLPKISLVSVLHDTNKFFHLLYTFLKLDYPREKLELIIVDDCDGEKRLKNVLPNDSRIKIVNITKKSGDKGVGFTLGYKLNMGVKYASHHIIYHFLEGNVYLTNHFTRLVKYFIMSPNNTPALFSLDTAIESGTENETGVIRKLPDLGNAMYVKNYWKVNTFDDTVNDTNVLMYKFLTNRLRSAEYLPFLYFSFKCSDKSNFQASETDNKLPFKLSKLIPNELVESYRMSKANEE